MASRPVVHLPRDLELDLSDPHSLTLRYPGDVHLSQTFGRPLAGAQVGGDLVLDLPRVTGTCVAQGAIRTDSDIDAIRLTGRELHLSGGEIRARALSATERILIGPCKLKVDVIIAPVVIIDPAARGRVTVMESRNEQGPTEIRGAFSLDEYEENFGGAREFLAGRGVGPLDDGVDVDELLSRPRAIVTTLRADGVTDDVAVRELGPEELEIVDLEPIDDLADADSFDGVSVVHPQDANPTLTPARGGSEQDFVDGPFDDPDSEVTLDPDADAIPDVLVEPLPDEDAGIIEPVDKPLPRAPTPMPPPPRGADDSPEARAWFRKLESVVQAIEETYGPSGPEALAVLREAVESGEPERVQHDLDTVWTDTVRFHKQGRTPVDPRVAHRFRVLHELVDQRPG